MSERPKILVLGAEGTVGRAVTDAVLARPEFGAIAGLHHPPDRRVFAEVRLVDATRVDRVMRAAEGASFAVNAVGGTPSQMLAATKVLCQVAPAAGLQRIVQISHMNVYGQMEGLAREDIPLAAAGSRFAACKIACEAVVRDFVAAGGDAVILRSGMVIGPGSDLWVGRVARWLMACRLGDLGVAGEGFFNFIYAPDLGDAVLQALVRPGARGRAINVSSPIPLRWNAYFAMLAEALGLAPLQPMELRRLSVEAGFWRVPLRALQLLAGGRRVPDPMSPALLRLWRQRIWLDSSLADEVLGFRRTATADAVARSVARLVVHRERVVA